MPQKSWSAKRERQYEHIKEGYEDRGVSEDEAEERAAHGEQGPARGRRDEELLRPEALPGDPITTEPR